MKKTNLILIILVLFFAEFAAFSQNCTVTIGKIPNAKPGDTVLIPVYVTGFKEIGTFGFTTPIDTNILINPNNDSLCITNISPLLSNGIMANFSFGDGDDNYMPELGIIYENLNFHGINIPNGKIFDLKFKYKGGSSFICFDTVNSEVSSSANYFNVNYFCGYISNNIDFCKAYFTFTCPVYSNQLIYNFIDASLGYNITKWLWNFGDSTTSTEKNPIHQYLYAGNYNICLKTTSIQNDSELCSSSYCEKLSIPEFNSPICNAAFFYFDNWDNINPSLIFFEDSVLASINSTEYGNYIDSCFWDFGDNTSSTGFDALHQYLYTGYFKVCLKVNTYKNGILVCTDRVCKIIYVPYANPCNAFISVVENDSIGSCWFSAWGSLGISTRWIFGDGDTSNNENPVHYYDTSGFYKVCVIVSNVNCIDTICQNVGFVSPKGCLVDFMFAYDDSIKGYYFNDMSLGYHITNWLWDFGDKTTSIAENPFHNFAKTGNYNVCLTIESIDSSNVICTNTYCQNALFYEFVSTNGNGPPPPDSTSLKEPNLKCEAGYTVLFDSISGEYYFTGLTKGDSIIKLSWNFGDSTTSDVLSPAHTFSKPGNYNVCFTINSINKGDSLCSDSYCETIIVNSLATGVNNNMLSDNIFSKIYPDPVNETANISVNSCNSCQNLRLDIYNYLGQFISTANTNYSPGTHTLSFSTSTLSKGMYFVRISGNNFTSVRSFVKIN